MAYRSNETDQEIADIYNAANDSAMPIYTGDGEKRFVKAQTDAEGVNVHYSTSMVADHNVKPHFIGGIIDSAS